MISKITRTQLRGALKFYRDILQLCHHPLAYSSLIQVQYAIDDRAQIVGSDLKRGQALRDLLRDAIDALKPDMGEQNFEDKHWRPYLILYNQYVRNMRPAQLSELWHIDRSTYAHELARAIDKLGELLTAWESDLELSTASIPSMNQKIGGGTHQLSIPFLVPSPPAYKLVGRDELLQTLKEVLNAVGGPCSYALNGLPGVGKTAIATALVHDESILSRFSDGILWANLGPRPEVQPILSSWAANVGLNAGQISYVVDTNKLIQAIHNAIGMRRMLLIIDDAWDIQTALLFKLGGPNCIHLLTTRRRGLAIDFAGNFTLSIPELGEQDSKELLQLFMPPLEGMPDVYQLADFANGLPLALTLMAQQAQKEAGLGSAQALNQFINSLAEPYVRLHLSQPVSPLQGHGNTQVSLSSTIATSFDGLAPSLQRALCALSTFPPKPYAFTETAANKTIGLLNMPGTKQTLTRTHGSQAQTHNYLYELVDTGLVELCGNGRYTIHRSIVDYVRENAPQFTSTPEKISQCLA